ncbi:MAG: hypothetical protein AAGA32_16480 [Pseudomonadota bacterium]
MEPVAYDTDLHKRRNPIERLSRKDWCGIPVRHDRRADTFMSAV